MSQRVYNPKVVGALIRVKLDFSKAEADSLELMMFDELFSLKQIDNTGKVVKHG